MSYDIDSTYIGTIENSKEKTEMHRGVELERQNIEAHKVIKALKTWYLFLMIHISMLAL